MRGGAILLAAAALAGGCAGHRPRPVLPDTTFSQWVHGETPPSPEELLEYALTSLRKVNNLVLRSQLRLTGVDLGGPNEAQSLVVFERPDKVRVEASQMLAPDVFTLISNGVAFWLLLPTQNQIWVGRHRRPPEIPFRGSQLLRPADLVAAFLFDDPVAGGPLRLQGPEGGWGWVGVPLSATPPDPELERVLWLDPAGGDPIRQDFVGRESGEIEAIVEYEDVQEVQELRWPFTVKLSRPAEGVALEIKTRRLRYNAPYPAGLFTFDRWPDGVEIVRPDAPYD